MKKADGLTIDFEGRICYTNDRMQKYNPSEEVQNMISREVVVNNASGLHARPATFFIQKANCYKSSIWVERDDRKVNAKSLLADGQDENSALEGLCELIDTGFSE